MTEDLHSHANVTHHRANSLYLRDVEKPTEQGPTTPFASTPNATASERNASATDDDRDLYDFSLEDAERYFLDHDYDVPQRTISHYCQHGTFFCKKFKANGTRRWFVQKTSADTHLDKMRRDGHATASERKRSQGAIQTPQEKEIPEPQETVLPSHTNAIANEEYKERYIAHLEEEVQVLRKQVVGFEEVAKGLGAVTAALLPAPSKNETDDDPNPSG